MSTGPIFDHLWLFAVGVFAVPLGTAYATAAAVRWRAAARGFTFDASQWALFVHTVALYLVMLVSGGLLLGGARGIPPGLSLLGVFAVLLAVYGGPLLLGTYLFSRVVSRKLVSSEALDSRTRVLGEASTLFAGLHVSAFPLVYAVAIAAS